MVKVNGRERTMSPIVIDDTTHANLRNTLEQSLGNDAIGLGDTTHGTIDGKNTVMDTWNDLGNTSAHTSLIAQIGHVLAAFSNDNASLFGRDDSAQGELLGGVLLLGTSAYVTVINVVVEASTTEVLGDVVKHGGILGRHDGEFGSETRLQNVG